MVPLPGVHAVHRNGAAHRPRRRQVAVAATDRRLGWVAPPRAGCAPLCRRGGRGDTGAGRAERHGARRDPSRRGAGGPPGRERPRRRGAVVEPRRARRRDPAPGGRPPDRSAARVVLAALAERAAVGGGRRALPGLLPRRAVHQAHVRAGLAVLRRLLAVVRRHEPAGGMAPCGRDAARERVAPRDRGADVRVGSRPAARRPARPRRPFHPRVRPVRTRGRHGCRDRRDGRAAVRRRPATVRRRGGPGTGDAGGDQPAAHLLRGGDADGVAHRGVVRAHPPRRGAVPVGRPTALARPGCGAHRRLRVHASGNLRRRRRHGGRVARRARAAPGSSGMALARDRRGRHGARGPAPPAGALPLVLAGAAVHAHDRHRQPRRRRGGRAPARTLDPASRPAHIRGRGSLAARPRCVGPGGGRAALAVQLVAPARRGVPRHRPLQRDQRDADAVPVRDARPRLLRARDRRARRAGLPALTWRWNPPREEPPARADVAAGTPTS